MVLVPVTDPHHRQSGQQQHTVQGLKIARQQAPDKRGGKHWRAKSAKQLPPKPDVDHHASFRKLWRFVSSGGTCPWRSGQRVGPSTNSSSAPTACSAGVYNDEGQPETVQYRKVNAMLLNEVQRQHQRIGDLERQLATILGRLARIIHESG